MDCFFNDAPHIITLNGQRYPFHFNNGVYGWTVTHNKTCFKEPKASGPSAHALIASSIAEQSDSRHLDVMTANTAASIVGRRLHAGLQRMANRTDMAAEVPPTIRAATAMDRSEWTLANAKRISHTGSRYSPSYAGRLIHMDTCGPCG